MRRRHYESLEEDDVSRQSVIAVIVSVLLSLAAAYGATRVQVQDIDTREKLNSTSAERAVERVAAENEKRSDKMERKIDERMDKFDDKLDILLQNQAETAAVIRRLERRGGN